MKILKIKIKDKFNEIKNISYKLYDNSLVDKWIKLTEDNFIQGNRKISSVFINKTTNDLPELIFNLNQILEKINNSYDIPIEIFDSLDTEKLNYLHEQFEKFGGRIESLHQSGKYDPVLARHFFSLNEHIHTIETALESSFPRWTGFGILYNLHPVGLHLDIQDQDLLFLEPHFTWGKLYLGYDTLGKDWMSIYQDNDIEVIERNMVKPQRRFAAESWLHFGVDQTQHEQISKFLSWVNGLDNSIKDRIPFGNLNDMRLGRYPIGEVLIDSEFLKIDPNSNNWKIYRHPSKLKWNYRVLSTYRTIESIEIETSNNN